MDVKFIAEVSSNHNGDLERCLSFVDKAVEIGCDTVKFQLFKISELFAPEILKQSEEHRERKKWELPTDYLPAISERCKKKGISLACTPFYLEAVEELLPYVDFYKISSYELLWEDLLVHCAHTGKPVVISTGMATLDEVKNAVSVLRNSGCKDIAVFHCVSGYPTPYKECNLSAIDSLRREVNCPIGWSDHSANPAVIYRAVHRWEASTIEFHLDLDGKGKEFYAGHCWLPEQIKAVIENLRCGLGSDGTGYKMPVPSEKPDREWRTDPNDGLRPMLHLRNP